LLLLIALKVTTVQPPLEELKNVQLVLMVQELVSTKENALQLPQVTTQRDELRSQEKLCLAFVKLVTIVY
jgi:hypothetical protein